LIYERRMADRRTRDILIFCSVGAAVAAVAALAGFVQGTDPAHCWQMAARYTARIAFPVFLAVFVASAWQRLAPGPAPRWLVRRRRALGLTFATMFTIHLICLTGNLLVSEEPRDLVALVVGGGAFVAMYALVLTSSDVAVRRLGTRRWRRLHVFGVYYLWFIFTFSYVGRAVTMPVPFAAFALACALALVVRIVGRRRAAKPALAAAA
jgi:methionine sulfoxide reductase heme-binding subunit